MLVFVYMCVLVFGMLVLIIYIWFFYWLGRLELFLNFCFLIIICLIEYELFLYDELELFYIMDLLFEEKVVIILVYDEIMEIICCEN